MTECQRHGVITWNQSENGQEKKMTENEACSHAFNIGFDTQYMVAVRVFFV